MASRGVREEDIARCYDIARNTWVKVKDRQPEVQAAIDLGRQAMHDALVGKLYERATKGSGDAIAAFFLLKTRFGYRENEVPADARPQVTIVLPGAAAVGHYDGKAERVIDVEPNAVVAALPAPEPARKPRGGRRG